MLNIYNKDKSNNIITEFIKKIYELDKLLYKLDEKIVKIDEFLNNLIDFYIKKKIFYFVENNIGYSNIMYKFKYSLTKFIHDLIDPTDNLIKKYICPESNNDIDKIDSANTNESNLNEVSDINSLMFRNFKKLNEKFEKNVTFDKESSSDNDDDDSKEIINTEPDKFINYDINNLPLYIKILINQNKYLTEFTEKLNFMCKILSDPELKYKKSNPFDEPNIGSF